MERVVHKNGSEFLQILVDATITKMNLTGKYW